MRDALRRKIRTTPFDPMRPAQDRLEDLLDRIRGCWLLYQENMEDDDNDAVAKALRAEANAKRDRLI
jgi:hypothetical protein